MANASTSRYHPQTYEQVERHDRTLMALLRCFVDDYQQDWDKYVSTLTYVYGSKIYRSTNTQPFDLVLS